MSICHTVIKFEVLSDEPIPNGLTLADIAQEAISGNYVGRWSIESCVEQPDEWAKKKLTEMGSDPAFFFPED